MAVAERKKRTDGAARKAASNVSRVGEAEIGRSGLLVDAVEDVLPACRGFGRSLVTVEIAGGAVWIEGRMNPSLHTRRRLEAPHEGVGSATVNADELARSLRSLRHEPVTVSTSPGGLTILGSARITLRPHDPEELPGPVQGRSERLGGVDQQELLRAIERVLHATSQDASRPTLQSVAIRLEADRAIVMATDSYRLAMVRIVLADYEGEPRTVLIDREQASYLLRRFKRWHGTGALEASDGWVGVDMQDSWSRAQASVVIREVEGEFPNVGQLIPAEADVEGTLTVGDVRALDELASAMGQLSWGNQPIRIELTRDGVTLSVTGEDGTQVETRLPGASYSGEPSKVAFNASYLAALARFAGGLPILRLKLRDALKPIWAGDLEQEGFTYLLMPVRIPGAVPSETPRAREPQEEAVSS